MMRCPKLLFVLISTALPGLIIAQDGEPDLSFASGATFQITSSNNFFYPVQIGLQSDGSIILSNSGDVDKRTRVRRLTTNGVQDLLFGNGGTAVINATGSGTDDLQVALVLSNNKTLLIINSYNYDDLPPFEATRFARLDANGTPDNTFGMNGEVHYDFSAGSDYEYFLDALELADGKVLVSGYLVHSIGITSALVRLNADGSLDETFDGDGFLQIEPGGSIHGLFNMVKLADGKILANGIQYANFTTGAAVMFITRLNSDGTLDTSFGQGGFSFPGLDGNAYYFFDLDLAADGNTVYGAAGYLHYGTGGSTAILARFLLNGTLDTSFNDDGLVEFNLGTTHTAGKQVAVQSSGRILLAGNGSDPTVNFIARFEADGNADITFGNQGIVISDNFSFTSINGLLHQPDGKILMSGYGDSTMFVTRFLCTDCSVSSDEPFQLMEIAVSPNPATDMTRLHINLPETQTFAVILYNAHGRLITTLQERKTFAAGEHVVTLHLPAGLPAGMYQLALHAGLGTKTLPLVVR